jgi:hypothetical protein
MKIKLYTITNLSGNPIFFFQKEENRDLFFDEDLEETCKKRFGKSEMSILIQDIIDDGSWHLPMLLF